MLTSLTHYSPTYSINLFNDFFSRKDTESNIEKKKILYDGLKKASQLLTSNEITKQEYEKIITELMAYYLENEFSQRIEIIFNRWFSNRKRLY